MKTDDLLPRSTMMQQLLGEPRLVVPERLDLASVMYKRVRGEIADFEAELNPDEEVALVVAQFGQMLTIRVLDLGYRNPSLMTVHGTTENGDDCTLMLHTTQLALLLVKAKVTDRPAHRIGFAQPSADATSDDE
jgi:hypothetical protein